MKKIDVSAAILINENKILCAQRGDGKPYVAYKFEFPGGKIEAEESPEEALHRELIEEMDVCVLEKDMELFCIVEHEYPDFEIKMYCYICSVSNREINLKEHISAVWKSIDEMDALDWAPADKPVVSALIKARGEKVC